MVKKSVNVVNAGDGNTDSSPTRKKNKQLREWFFTFNNYLNFGKSGDEYFEKFKNLCSKFKFQEEIGEISGIVHLQGNLLFKKSYRITELKNIIYQANWGPTRNSDAAFSYCEKEDTATGKRWSFGFPEEIEIIKDKDLRPFQKELLEICLGKPDRRKIYWIYDEYGNAGKTQFLKYMFVKYGAIFSYGGKKSDIINLVFNNKKYLLESKNKIMFYNFARDIDNKHISYDSMEQIKDGCISNTKFEAGCFCCNSPHIIIFANCLPLMSKLTVDKWVIKTIDPNNYFLMDYKMDVSHGLDMVDEMDDSIWV